MHLYISVIFSASGHRDIHMAAHRSNIKRVVSLLNTRTCACNCWGLYLGVYVVLWLQFLAAGVNSIVEIRLLFCFSRLYRSILSGQHQLQ